MIDEEEDDAALTTTTDKNALANLILEKLQELTEIFEQKNEDYATMEERSEELHKVGVAAWNQLLALDVWVWLYL